MRNPLKQLGRGAMLLAATSLLIAVNAVVPAEAVNKAGVPCKKANAKTKIGGDRYVCTKNPTVKKAKLTWVWIGCVDSNKLYLESSARLITIKETADQAVSLLETEIAALKEAAPTYETEAKAYDQKASEVKVKQAAALLDAKANTDNATRVGENTIAGKQYTSNAAIWIKAARSYELAAKNFERSAASIRNKISEIDKKEKQKVNVLQTVENTKSEVKSTLQNRKQACTPGL